MKIYYLAYKIYVSPTKEEEIEIKKQLKKQLVEKINDSDTYNRPHRSQGGPMFDGLVPGSEEYEQLFKECLDNMYFVYCLEKKTTVTTTCRLLNIQKGETKEAIENKPNFIKWMPDSFNKFKAEENRREEQK